MVAPPPPPPDPYPEPFAPLPPEPVANEQAPPPPPPDPFNTDENIIDGIDEIDEFPFPKLFDNP